MGQVDERVTDLVEEVVRVDDERILPMEQRLRLMLPQILPNDLVEVHRLARHLVDETAQLLGVAHDWLQRCRFIVLDELCRVLHLTTRGSHLP